MYIRFRRKRRLKAFGNQLPFALDLIKSIARGGPFAAARIAGLVRNSPIRSAASSAPCWSRRASVCRCGRALEDMLQRVPEEDLQLLVVAVKVQTEVGSSLAAIIGRLSEIVRIRQRLRLQIKRADRAIADGRNGGRFVAGHWCCAPSA